MEIRDKWVVCEIRDNLYFTGMNSDNYPVLESLSSRVRQYNSKRAAECAIRRIRESAIECCEFIAEYLKSEVVPDVSEDDKSCSLYDELHRLCDKYNISFGGESQGFGAELADLARKFQRNIPDIPQDKLSEPPIIKYDEGWSIVDQFGKKILYVRKEAACRYIYAVLDSNGDLRGFGFDEKAAWIWYSNYRRDIGVRRIEERLGKQQNSERRECVEMTCPICKKTLEENGSWMQCPKYKAPVCEKHCSKCEHHTDFGGTSIVRCLFPKKA